MSSDNREKSWEQGAPVEYYDFIRETTHWRYNTSDREQELNGEVYLPLNISRERIQHGVERNKLALAVNLPRTAEVADNWHPYPTSVPVGLTIYSGHIGEDDAFVVWIGRVISPKFTPSELNLTCEPSTTLSRKSGQAQCWQRGCMHVLYKQGDGLCNALRENFGVAGTLTAATNSTVKSATFAGFEDGRLAGGYLEWVTDTGTVERRSINSHLADSIELFYGANDLAVGTEFTVYPGCKHTWNDCEGYFENGVNYGGDLYAPERSPFNGNPVY